VGLWSASNQIRNRSVRRIAAIFLTENERSMKTLCRNTLVSLLPALGLLIVSAAAWAQQMPTIVEKMAKTYGLDSFKQIQSIRYTFTLQSPILTRSESWTWEPKTDRVTFEGKGKSGKPVKVTYLRSQLGSQSAEVKQDIDSRFVDDQYWLLLPLHVYSDGAPVQNAGEQKLLLGKGSAEKVVVKYGSGGYSPGDTWELYLDPDGRIQEMAYHRSGPKKLDVIATWATYKKAGPLLLSLDHRGTINGKALHLFFSNVAVWLVGSNSWIGAR
jgi:hypothetical protein